MTSQPTPADRRRWQNIGVLLRMAETPAEERVARLLRAVESEPAADGRTLAAWTRPVAEALWGEANRFRDVLPLIDRVRSLRPAAWAAEAQSFSLLRAEALAVHHTDENDLIFALLEYAPFAGRQPEPTANLVAKLLWYGPHSSTIHFLYKSWDSYGPAGWRVGAWGEELLAYVLRLTVDMDFILGNLPGYCFLRPDIVPYWSREGDDVKRLITDTLPRPDAPWSLREFEEGRGPVAAVFARFRRRLFRRHRWSPARAALAERQLHAAYVSHWGRETSRSAADRFLPTRHELVRWGEHYFERARPAAGYLCAAYLEALQPWAQMLVEMGLADARTAEWQVRAAHEQGWRLPFHIGLEASDWTPFSVALAARGIRLPTDWRN